MLYQRSDRRRLKALAADQRLTASLRRAESWAATRMNADELAQIERQFGVAPEQVERAQLIFLAYTGVESVWSPG